MFRIAVIVVLASSAVLPLSAAPAPKEGPRRDFLFYKKVPASSLKVTLSPGATVTRTGHGLVLPLRITNRTGEAIVATLAHEWHGGEWPPTALYASVTPAGEKKARPFEPVYRMGEDQRAPRPVTLAAGQSLHVELRMDWAGTGSVIGVPLVRGTGKYRARFALVFEVGGRRQYALSGTYAIELKPM